MPRLKIFVTRDQTGAALPKLKTLYDVKINLEDRVIQVKNPDNAQILNDFEIKALIVPKEPDERMLEKVNFPIIEKEDISFESLKNILVVKKELFEEKLNKARKRGFVQWLSGHKKRKL